nr:myb/SANT-like DNA-binding domain-containing protein 4 [Aedes albopictus]
MPQEREGFDCKMCDLPNTSDNMVMCDACLDWYHLGCAGVSPGVEKRPWRCESCLPLSSAPAPSIDKVKGKNLPSKGKTATGLTVPITSETLSVANSKKSSKARKTKASVPIGDVAEHVLPTGASLAHDKTPKKHPEIPKRADTVKGSARSSAHSSRALAQLSLLRLEEKQKLEEQKLEIQRQELQKERDRLRKEKELEEQENAITRKQLQMRELYLEEKHDLQEQLIEDGAFSQCSSRSRKSMTRKWLQDQRNEHELKKLAVEEPSIASESSAEESVDEEEEAECAAADLPMAWAALYKTKKNA